MATSPFLHLSNYRDLALGINVYDNQRVEYDDSHQDRVDTSLERNMSYKRFHDVDYHFVFRRLPSENGDGGDGNPLMYALKEMRGYRMNADCKANLLKRAQEIVLKDSDKLSADIIIPVASSYPFCREFAVILGECLGIPVADDVLVKKRTIAQIIPEAEAMLPNIKKPYDKRLLKAQIKQWKTLPENSEVTMKRVEKKIRKYFSHLEASGPIEKFSGKSVLVIDDLLASGNSMQRTITLLQANGVHVAAGVCFLSGL